MVWLAFAFMTAAAVLCVSWPMLRPRRTGAACVTDVAFYRQQLTELDADVDRGILRPADVEATRAELGRRLLQAAERPGVSAGPARRRAATAAAAGGFVVLATAGLYAEVGHPDQPDAPLSARAADRTDFAAAMARIEAHLASDPDDGRGLEIVAPIYMKVGRFDDAARAYRDALRVLGPSPARRSALGQALVMAADGVVTAEARQNFDAALSDDPLMPQARFFEGLAALQDGDRAKARDTWTALVRDAPPEAPYAGIVRQRLAELDGAPAPAPALPAAAAAVASLPADQRQVAIRGMVDGLAARLAQDGGDPDGWLRLVRAYRVLGEGERARRALADARRAMTGDAQVLGRLDQLAHELGLEG